jgi:hypothetical protein
MRNNPQETHNSESVGAQMARMILSALVLVIVVGFHLLLIFSWLDFWVYLKEYQFPRMPPEIAENSRQSNLNSLFLFIGMSLLVISYCLWATFLKPGFLQKVISLAVGLIAGLLSLTLLGVAHI